VGYERIDRSLGKVFKLLFRPHIMYQKTGYNSNRGLLYFYMRKLSIILALALLLLMASCSSCKANTERIKIRHADPALIFRLLKGMNPTQPEFSTLVRK